MDSVCMYNIGGGYYLVVKYWESHQNKDVIKASFLIS